MNNHKGFVYEHDLLLYTNIWFVSKIAYRQLIYESFGRALDWLVFSRTSLRYRPISQKFRGVHDTKVLGSSMIPKLSRNLRRLECVKNLAKLVVPFFFKYMVKWIVYPCETPGDLVRKIWIIDDWWLMNREPIEQTFYHISRDQLSWYMLTAQLKVNVNPIVISL